MERSDPNFCDLVGEPIKTVDDLTNAIKSGKVDPSDIEVDYVIIDGTPSYREYKNINSTIKCWCTSKQVEWC